MSPTVDLQDSATWKTSLGLLTCHNPDCDRRGFTWTPLMFCFVLMAPHPSWWRAPVVFVVSPSASASIVQTPKCSTRIAKPHKDTARTCTKNGSEATWRRDPVVNVALHLHHLGPNAPGDNEQKKPNRRTQQWKTAMATQMAGTKSSVSSSLCSNRKTLVLAPAQK